MARLLPIYPELPSVPVESTEPVDYNPQCSRCPLSAGVKTVCMKAEYIPAPSGPTLLVVVDYPGVDDDHRGRPAAGKSGKVLRHLLRRWWKGPVVIDNALKCKPGDRTIRPTFVKNCLGHLAATIRETKPDRILAMGTHAIHALLGRRVPPFSARGAYGWTTDPVVPIFLLMNPTAATRNRFIRQWIEKDMEWALNVQTETLADKRQWDAYVSVVETEDDCREAYEVAKQGPFIAYDAETTGRFYDDGSTVRELSDGAQVKIPPFDVLCLSFNRPGDEVVYTWDSKALKNPVLFAWLKRIFEHAKVKVAGQNEKYDRHCMVQLGIIPKQFHWDTRLVRRLHDPEAKADLVTLQFLVGMGGGKDEMKAALTQVVKRCRQRPIKKNPDRGSDEDLASTYGWERMDLVRAVRSGAFNAKTYSFGLVDEDLMLRYNGADTLSTALVAAKQIEEDKHKPAAVRRVWRNLVRPLAVAIQQVEDWGIAVDMDAVNHFQVYTMMQQQKAGTNIQKLADAVDFKEFNPDKTADVRELLFGRLKLRPVGKTGTGLPSTDKKSLDALKHKHPIIEDIMTWRRISKQRGTYADPLSAHIRADGRVHPSINVDGARSGRPSCQNPNLFNVPRAKTPAGKMARDCYSVCDWETHDLISVDFSQLELRESAIESGDVKMIDIFLSGQDYHLKTAQMVAKQAWGMEPEEITKDSEERTKAKSINFGILYGMGSWALAEAIGSTPEEAELLMHSIMGGFPDLKRFIKASLNEARRDGGVWTQWEDKPFRWRPLWRIADQDSQSRSKAENGSFNTKIQGKASDRCLFSLVEVVNWILNERVPAKLVCTVYDSLLIECRKDVTQEVLYTVPELMLQWANKGVPIVVDGEVGPSWGSLESAGSTSSR